MIGIGDRLRGGGFDGDLVPEGFEFGDEPAHLWFVRTNNRTWSGRMRVGNTSSENKSFQIPKRLAWEAYQSVKKNKGAAGVDGQSIEGFEADLKNNLYKIWNRMSSGTYFPPPVRAVEIPKPHGGAGRSAKSFPQVTAMPEGAAWLRSVVSSGNAAGQRGGLPDDLLSSHRIRPAPRLKNSL